MPNDLYIGAPNGIVLCVDRLNQWGCSGEFYHAYQKEGTAFSSLGEMLFLMEEFFDKLNFPRRGNAERHFIEQEKTEAQRRPTEPEGEKVMSDKELLNHHGQSETFIVRVQHRQNNTWQGRITWADKNKTLNFRSIWEMVHLMEEAIYEDAPPEEIPETQTWEEE